MFSATINKINFTGRPSKKQIVRMEYRDKSHPDVPENYILLGSEITVNEDGSISEIYIPNLIDGRTYVLKITNSCSKQTSIQEFSNAEKLCVRIVNVNAIFE